MSLLEVDGSKLRFLESLLWCLFVASFRRFYLRTICIVLSFVAFRMQLLSCLLKQLQYSSAFV